MKEMFTKCFGVVFFCGVSLLFFSTAQADKSCGEVHQDIPGRNSIGSASTWSNLRSAEGSVKKEIANLLAEAEKKSASLTSPPDLCPGGCDGAKVPTIVLRSVPNKFSPNSDGSPDCRALQSQTTKSPFIYDGKNFASLDELNSWFGDFSQGKGKEGGDLYEKCPGDCSPQYTNLIQPLGGRYLLRSEVVCGMPRDKSDNQYKLSIAYRWGCKTKR